MRSIGPRPSVLPHTHHESWQKRPAILGFGMRALSGLRTDWAPCLLEVRQTRAKHSGVRKRDQPPEPCAKRGMAFANVPKGAPRRDGLKHDNYQPSTRLRPIQDPPGIAPKPRWDRLLAKIGSTDITTSERPMPVNARPAFYRLADTIRAAGTIPAATTSKVLWRKMYCTTPLDRSFRM